ncbi:MAG: FAD-binding protein [Bacteroidia bacterium]|nr:FAD-binding protein [Bacteroidia bacterium]
MKPYKKIEATDIEHFNSIVGSEYLVTDVELMEPYSHDETEDLVFYPELVIRSNTSEEISKILKYCNEKNIPVTPRAGGTGLSGGALAVNGGVILSLERMNRILKIDERNLQVIVEPGVITEKLQEAVIEKGLFYPPDPASKGSCFIGGNIAESSGGPKAVKYGTTKDYVLNLEVVLPTGEIIRTGANVLKNSTGYNLTQLITGSEGTLGIVTKIVLRLIPYPAKNIIMLVPFYSSQKACEAVSAIFTGGVTPSGLEFMERDALVWGLKYIEDAGFELKEGIEAHLLIEVDGQDEQEQMKECEKIYGILKDYPCDEVLIAETALHKDRIMKFRRGIGEAVKSNSVYREEDTVVPRAELAVLLKGVKDIGKKYNFQTVCYGHAGDGNLHVNIIRGDLSDHDWNVTIRQGIREIFELTVSLGGTISGEHGIGLTQKDYLNIALDSKVIDLMKQIKTIFDPNGILNPGKIFI